jgi:hypothetical protein
MTPRRPGVVVASTKRRLPPTGNLTYPPAAIDRAAGGSKVSLSAWTLPSRVMRRSAQVTVTDDSVVTSEGDGDGPGGVLGHALLLDLLPLDKLTRSARKSSQLR